MAFTWVLRYPGGEERTVTTDLMLIKDKVLALRPPLSAADAVSEAQKLYATGQAPDGATLVRYRITDTVDEAQERVMDKIEMIKVAILEAHDGT